MKRKTIIACAVTGGTDWASQNPAVPVTPAQIADSAIGAAQAGAAIVHLHVRDPATGKASADPALFREAVGRIRESGVDVIVNLTTSDGAIVGVDERGVAHASQAVRMADERFLHVAELRPELCSMDMGTFNLGSSIFYNAQADLERMAAHCLNIGVLPELEVFDSGHIECVRTMLAAGQFRNPAFVQICLGFPGGSRATPEALLYLKSLLPPDVIWAAFGTGLDAFPIVAMATAMGGHVRIGLEDTLFIEDGVLAPSNAALVAKAASIVELMGSAIATPADARNLLKLSDNGLLENT